MHFPEADISAGQGKQAAVSELMWHALVWNMFQKSQVTHHIVLKYDASQSMDQHFMTSYHHAILSIILAQFSPKGFLDDVEGIVRLVKDLPYLQVCSVL